MDTRDSDTQLWRNSTRTAELLEQPWRLRRYLEQLPEGSIAGQRQFSTHCPLACWLQQETNAEDEHVITREMYALLNKEQESGLLRYRPLPLWASLFVAVIDSVEHTPDVSRLAALEALDQAEYEVTQRLLPQWSSRSRCVGMTPAGRPCHEQGIYQLHAFLGDRLTDPATFYEINGLVCETCFARIVIPPRSWWQQVEDERLLAFIGVGAGG